MKYRLLLLLILALPAFQTQAQKLPNLDSVRTLLNNVTIQIEITSGVDDMYNFRFERAENQFMWLRRNYPTHPLPYFLMGLSNWWKILPNVENTKYDAIFLSYMDSTIAFAEPILDKDKTNWEAAFFLAGAHAFKGRLYSERKNWTKATVAGKKALDYMEYSRGHQAISPELLFGDGVYNYYSVWIPENYPVLKPVLWFFRKGDKALGIEQLEMVFKEAFYARIEAAYFLMRIYAVEENKPDKGLRIATYLHELYPNNPYFHRFYARMLYSTGNLSEIEPVCLQIIERIENGTMGYEEISGRYASFYLGAYYRLYQDFDKAEKYLKMAVDYSEKIGQEESGYYLYSLAYLAQIAKHRKNYPLALAYYEKILNHAEKKHPTKEEAKAFKKGYKKLVK